MTEFTKEFIAKQREILMEITAIPWALCTCGKCTQIHSIPMDVEVVDVMSHVKNCYDEGFPCSTRYHADAKYIEQACNNYPEALDEISRLQARIAELEEQQRWIPANEFIAKEGGVYYFEDLRGELLLGYLQPKDKLYAQLEHYVKRVFAMPLPPPPESEGE